MALGLDPRILSEPSKLEMRGLISAKHRQACFKIGDIYRAWHHWHSQKPQLVSPNLEPVRKSSDWIAELFDPDAAVGDTTRRDDITDAIQCDEDDFRRLQSCLGRMRKVPDEWRAWSGAAQRSFPGDAGDAIFRLCVLNQTLTDREVLSILPMLDAVVYTFNIGTSKKGKAALPAMSAVRQRQARRTGSKSAFLETLAIFAPDRSQEDCDAAFEAFQARMSREKYRGEKQSA